jgi:thiamine biosynthesis protein ThiS
LTETDSGTTAKRVGLDAIAITVNGAARAVPVGSTITDLLASLGLRDRLVAVERNGQIVPQAALVETLLKANDRLEIVHFVGGG